MRKSLFIVVVTIGLGGVGAWLLVERYNERPIAVQRAVVPDGKPATGPLPVKLPVRLAVAVMDSVPAINRKQSDVELLTDTLTVELGQHNGFTLVERTEINRVLNELALSLSQNPEQRSIKAGKMLGCDWFVMASLLPDRTNMAVFKIVDVPSSFVRDMTAISLHRTNIVTAAQEIAAFTARATNSLALDRTLIVGLGSFADWSVNNRYPNFSHDIRQRLERASVGKRIHFVERGAIHALLREMQFNTVGLSDRATTNAMAQPAMFVIDGVFQSYQDEQAKVSVVLRVQRVGEREQLFAFTEPVGAALVDKMIARIESILTAQPLHEHRVTSREEAAIQLERGKERAAFSGPIRPGLMLGGAPAYRDPEKRLRTIEEAIEAFESALFLDAKRVEAKLYLGVLLADPSIGRVGEAQDYLREVISSARNREWVADARATLAQILPEPPRKALTLAEELEKETKTWLEKCKSTQAVADADGSTNPFDLTSNTYNVFLRVFRFDTAATRKYLDETLRRIAGEYPRLKHYFAGSYARWCAQNGGVAAAQMDGIGEALVEWSKHPEPTNSRRWFYRSALWPDIEFCLSSNRVDIALQVIEIMERLDGPALTNTAPYLSGKGAALMKAERWSEALPLFEKLTNAAYNVDVFLQLDTCRERLAGNVASSGPTAFNLGAPVRLFLDAPVLKHDGKDLWVAAQNAVYRLSNDRWLREATPTGLLDTIEGLAVSPDLLALGTVSSGVFVCERSSGKWTQFTEREGLLMPAIKSLCIASDKVWIGFGDDSTLHGGIGYIDWPHRKFVGLTPGLKVVGTSVQTDTYDQPPKGRVVALCHSRDALWVGARGKGLQRFDLVRQAWDTATSRRGFDNKLEQAVSDAGNLLTSCAVNREFVVVGTDIGGSYTSRDKHWGGLSYYSFQTKSWQIIGEQRGLPNGYVLCVAAGEKQLWAGGRSFVVEIDPSRARVTRIADLGRVWAHGIEVSQSDLWIAAGNQLFRVPRPN
jgi:tetratricopeptide (TPR) repeat protein